MSVDTTDGHPEMDYPEHLRTYHGFLRGAVVLVTLSVIVLLGLLFFAY
ncbi:MAG: aa3-type cytochrome c oxidase subunit IV [Hyphomicrobiaceae bacterium]